MPPPEKIEVKLAFRPEDTAKAVAVLKLSETPNEERRIHFFDTSNLALFDRGLILRVRQTVTGTDSDDVTLKVRGPGAPGAAERFLEAAKNGARFEGDQNIGREETPSFSITTKPGGEAIAAVLTDAGKLVSVLNEAGKTLLREMGGTEADPAVLKCLGPIRAKIWKFQPAGFAGKITAELWDVAGAQMFEISDKAPRLEAPALGERLKNLVPDSTARRLDASKTRFALELLARQHV
jgi:hypothetical protein